MEVTVDFVHFVVGQVGHVGVTVTVFFPLVVVTVVVEGVQGSAELLLGVLYAGGGFAAPSAAVLKARTARIVCRML